MYKHECYKLFMRKSIYIVFFLIVLLLVYANREPMLDWVMKDEIYEDLAQTYGGPVTEKLESEVREQMRMQDSGEAAKVDQATGNVQFIVAMSGMNLAQLEEKKELLTNQSASLNEADYQYKEVVKELEMLEALDNPYGFYRIQSWKGMMDLIEPFFSVVLIAIMILLGLSPVFSEDYYQKTVGLILATKHGKKRLVSAKLLASITYIAVIFISLHLVNFIINLNAHGGLSGWDAPIQSLVTYPADYTLTPFSWEVWQFYFVVLTVQFLAGLAFGILILLLSLITKNVLITFFISGSILGVPFVFRQIGLDQGLFETFNSFSYLEFIRVERLFNTFKAYNILGNPVLYPTALLSVFTMITLILIGILYYRSKHQQVKY